MYAIVTKDHYYNSFDAIQNFESFKSYDEATFRAEVRKLTLAGVSFRAFRITPVTVTTTVNIDIT